MWLLKHLAGLGIFLVTLYAALTLTGVLVAHAPRLVPTTKTNVTTPAAPAAGMTHQIQLVTLDRESGRSHTKLTLALDAHFDDAHAPERVWVWTYFFTPNDRRSWAGEPIEVRAPFRDGARRVAVTVNGDCPPCDDASAPASGYYARVHVSAEAKESAVLLGHLLNLDITRAAPVVVQAEQR